MNRDLVFFCVLVFSRHVDVNVFGGNIVLIFVAVGQFGDRIRRQQSK